ncbi:MAG: M28 family peptidase [Bacteriovoracaceae bacterium]|nr:M28 family peptidase [Bacteriovoracaceae bacterium]
MSPNSKLAQCAILIALFPIVCFSQNISISKYEKSPKHFRKVKSILAKISQSRFEKNLRAFVRSGHPSRMVGLTGNKNASKFVVQFIKKVDPQHTGKIIIDEFKPDVDKAIREYQRDFKTYLRRNTPATDPQFARQSSYANSVVQTLQSARKLVGKNIIWEKKGIKYPKEVIIVGAHLDTIALTADPYVINADLEAHGADNNASGVAVNLSMLSILAKLDLPRTIRVVFFDFEELGNLGARRFVKKHLKRMIKNQESIIGFVNLLSLGHDTKMADKTKTLRNMKVYISKAHEKGYFAELNLANKLLFFGSKAGLPIKFALTANGFTASSIRFKQAGVPSIVFSHNREEDNNSKHYTSNDFVETLNIRSLYYSFKFISSSIISLLFDLKR